jgi:hypothetical protein
MCQPTCHQRQQCSSPGQALLPLLLQSTCACAAAAAGRGWRQLDMAHCVLPRAHANPNAPLNTLWTPVGALYDHKVQPNLLLSLRRLMFSYDQMAQKSNHWLSHSRHHMQGHACLGGPSWNSDWASRAAGAIVPRIVATWLLL